MSLTPQQRKRLAVYSFVRGFQYEHGLDVERDLNEAYKSYHTAAQLDHVDAIYACAWFLKSGSGVERNPVSSLSAFRKAAERGHIGAQACVAQAIALGEGIEANPEQALKLFKKIYDSCDDAEFKKEIMKRGTMIKEYLANAQKASEAVVTPSKPLDIDDLKRLCNVPRRKEDLFKLGLDIERGKFRNIGIEYAIVCFREAGREGHLDANIKVGNCYANGIGVRQDMVNAIRWYQKSARKNHGEAMYLLASAYATGIGIDRDIEEAKKWSLMSIQKGFPKAKGLNAELSKIRKDKDGCFILPENLQFANAANQTAPAATAATSDPRQNEPVETLRLPPFNRKISNPPSIPDLVELAKEFFRSDDESDHLKAFHLFKLCVFRKNADALIGLGDCYRLGRGTHADPEKAFRSYELAASHGSPAALYKLGLCYKNGFGVKVDFLQYKHCLQKAVALGYADGAAELQGLSASEASASSGEAQNHAPSVEPRNVNSSSLNLDSLDPEELCVKARNFESDPEGGKEIAFSLYLKAAQKDYIPAFSSLGYCLENGIGCIADIEKAIEYYQTGFSKGSSEAAFLLGKLYFFGKGVEKDWNKAKEIFDKVTDPELKRSKVEKLLKSMQKVPKTINSKTGKQSKANFKQLLLAAQKGDSDAQYELGLCYEKGNGTSINLEEALKWFCFASITNESAKAKYEYMVQHQGPKSPYDQLQLGRKLFSKTETIPLAAYWIEKAAKSGYADAQFMLGVIYALGNGKPRSMAYASQWFSYAAAQGHTQSMYNLACLIEKQNSEAALELYEKSFGLGLQKSMDAITRLLEILPAETKDTRNLDWYRKCALMEYSSMLKGLEEYERKLGFPKLDDLSDFEMYNTGYAYESDESIDQDGRLAAHYYLHGSLNNNSRCLYRLGCFYEVGYGVPSDINLAFVLLERAANLNEVEALLKVAKWLEDGKGSKMDLEKAFKFYEKANSYGNAYGAYHLGLCYEFGKGTSIDIKKAIRYYLEAVNGNCYPAQIALEERYPFVLQPDFKLESFQEPSSSEYISKVKMMDLIWTIEDTGADLEEENFDHHDYNDFEVEHSNTFRHETQAYDEHHEQPKEDEGKIIENDERHDYEDEQKEDRVVELSSYDQNRSLSQSPVKSEKEYTERSVSPVASQKEVEELQSKKEEQREKEHEEAPTKPIEARANVATTTTAANAQSSEPISNVKQPSELVKEKEIAPVSSPATLSYDKESAESLSERARGGDLEAAYALGVKYINGDGVTQNFELGIRWLNTASVGGVAKAKYEIGLMYEKGQGVSHNLEKAFKWFLAAAREGIVDAMYKVGRAFDYGSGIAKNHGEAVEWYTKASDKGNLAALNNLACCYEYGTGVDKNVVKAAECYEKAASQGYVQSIFCTAWCYEQGIGVDVDIERAVGWYKKAAAQKENKAISSKAALKIKQLTHKE